jgi:hypothetical protein
VLISSGHKLLHSIDSGGVASIDGKQYTLNSLRLVRLRVTALLPAVGGQTEELGQNKQVLTERRASLFLGLLGCISLDFLQRPLPFGFFGGRFGSVLVVDFLVLSKLLFELGKLGLERRFLLNLGFLVRVDDLGGYQIVEGLSLVLFEEFIGFGDIGLETMSAFAHPMEHSYSMRADAQSFCSCCECFLKKIVSYTKLSLGNTMAATYF